VSSAPTSEVTARLKRRTREMESSILSDFSQIIFFVNPEATGRVSLEPKKVEIPRIAAVMGRPDLSRAGAVFKTVFFCQNFPRRLSTM